MARARARAAIRVRVRGWTKIGSCVRISIFERHRVRFRWAIRQPIGHAWG